MYEAYLEDAGQYTNMGNKPSSSSSLCPRGRQMNTAYIVINNLRKICNHPMLFLQYQENP